MVDLVLMQANGPHQIHLNFVAGGEAADQRASVFAALLRHRQDRRDIVAGVAVFRRQKSVVIVQLTHGRAIGPGGPFRMHPQPRIAAKHRRPPLAQMRERLGTRGHHRVAIDRGDRHSGIVDDPVHDHLGDDGLHLHRIGGDGGDLPGELIFSCQAVFFRMNPNLVSDHAAIPLSICGVRVSASRLPRMPRSAAATCRRINRSAKSPSLSANASTNCWCSCSARRARPATRL